MQSSAAETVSAGATPASLAVALRDVTISFRLGAGTTYTAVEQATLSVADGAVSYTHLTLPTIA